MNNHKVLATFVVAILVASALVAVGRMTPLQSASAQAVTIKTSADSHAMKFFGESFLQVIVTDPSKDDDNVQQEVNVDIDADPSGSFTSASGTFVIPETSDSSSRFEFYLAFDTSPDPGIDADNSNGVAEYTGANTEAPIIRFGGAQELPVTSGLFDDVSFDITVGDEQITVKYEETSGALELDRSTYGSDSVVHLFVVDQDANKDPTNTDSFTVSAADLNTVVFDMNGATFNTTVTFDETGDNTARFEAILNLGTDVLSTAESVQVTLNDRANYDSPSATENDSQDTSSQSFDIDDVDGQLDNVTNLTFGSELKLTLRDNDQNKDSEDSEDINDAVTVRVDTAGGDNETIDLTETDDNTGVFLIDLSNDELPITFLADGVEPTANNSKLELRQGDITEDIIAEYTDQLDDNAEVSVTSSFTLEMTLAVGSVDVPDAAGINDDFLLTLTDADLNDNPRTKDSYSFVLNEVGPYNLKRGSNEIGDVANLEFEIEGNDVDFGTQTITYTLVETDVNSGVFTVSLDMEDFLAFGDNGAALSVDDGDTLRVTYNDLMDTISRESIDELAIGKANSGVDFTRTTLPTPPEAGSAVADGLGTEVTTTIVVTDPDSNVLSGAEDVIGFNLGTDAGEFSVEVDGDGFNAVIDAPGEETSVTFQGTNLADIMQFDGLSLSETGSTTGVFDDDIIFTHGSLSTDDWQDLKITITYVNDNLDEDSAGVTFRGNDGTITVDQTSAKAGTILGITVEDQDLNLDDTSAEEFSSTDSATGNYIVAVETEDDEIAGIRTEQFRETGADTGVFTAEFTVGTDIPISELPSGDDKITQATNILITYNDEVDGSGGSGDELEVNVPVASATGALQFMPELIGPGTSVTVLLTDTDLDQDSKSTDSYDTTDPNGDNFMVSFRSDRTEVGRASPDIEETGPNTGVFDFTIDLITDESACEDDDLGATRFDAQGGSEPQIGACPGDLISVKYEDEQDGSGRSSVASTVLEVKSWDPEFSSDKPTYNVGDRVTITISDPDANRDPDVADSLKDVRVFSNTDRVGQDLSALETGRDTGVFRLVFGTTSTSQGGAITVKTGDEATVQYTDDFPADFSDQENDKDFTFVVPFGAAGANTGATTPTEPVMKDSSGGIVNSITTGQQIVLTTTITNNLQDVLHIVALIEVRDSTGVTQFLAFQSADVDGDGRVEIGQSWIPSASGDYQVRTFVISSLNNPSVLSEVKTTDITVS